MKLKLWLPLRMVMKIDFYRGCAKEIVIESPSVEAHSEVQDHRLIGSQEWIVHESHLA